MFFKEKFNFYKWMLGVSKHIFNRDEVNFLGWELIVRARKESKTACLVIYDYSL